jgi:hypothetical protein
MQAAIERGARGSSGEREVLGALYRLQQPAPTHIRISVHPLGQPKRTQ